MKTQSREAGSNHHRGSVLLFCLGVLAVLSLLGTALLFMTRREENAAREYMNETRAEFAAESGVETAIAKLMNYQGAFRNVSKWLEPFPKDPDYPMKYLAQSTFGIQDIDGDGLKETAGVVSETFAKDGDRFKLRVQCAQSKLNINDTNSPHNIDTDPYEDQWTPERKYNEIPSHLRYPTVPNDPGKDKDPDWLYPGDPEFDPTRSPNSLPHPKAPGRLEVIVGNFLANLFPFDASEPEGPNNRPASHWKTAAKKLFEIRRAKPSDAFETFADIKNALVPDFMGGDQYKRFESLIALHSWQDKNVIRPTFQWRINTPPIIDSEKPDLPPTQHLSDYPGDYASNFPIFNTFYNPAWPWQGPICPRPGHLNPGVRGQDLMGAVEFDFNNDRGISANEKVRHDHDIYIFSDMQTRYFALDPRSPLDINDIGPELMEALISPVRGWYLQEAPATWRGEALNSRAEDWSQPACDGVYHNYHFPWFFTDRFQIDIVNGVRECGGYANSGWPDESQYYYYDAYAKSYLCTKPNFWWDYLDGNVPQPTDPFLHSYQCAEKSARFGELKETEPLTNFSIVFPDKTISQLLTEKIQNRIHKTDLNGDGEFDFNPFRTWEEVEEFILDLADLDAGDNIHLTGDIRDFDIYMAHAVIANFNPNSRLNDFNPDKRGFLYVDKSQLSGFSAEFCFHTMGETKIECLGQVFDDKGKEISSSSILCQLGAWECFRVSTQEQFMRGYDGTPSSAKKILGESNGEVPTAGGNTEDGNLPNGSFRGYTLQSYPEAELEFGDHITKSYYDGCLRLATLQVEQQEFFAFGTSQLTNNCFVANFRGTMDADYGEGPKELVRDNSPEFWMVDHWRFRLRDGYFGNPSTQTIPRSNYPPSFGGWLGPEWGDMLPDVTAQVPANNPGLYQSLCKPLTDIFSGDQKLDQPGHLHPDGVLSDTGRTPKYAMVDPNPPYGSNFGDGSTEPPLPGHDWEEWVAGKRGSVQFWIKPNFDVAHSNRVRNLFCAPPRAGNWDIPETWPHPGGYIGSDMGKDFSLYYFSRGGRRVPVNPDTGRLDDACNHISKYHPHYDFHEGRWLPTRSLMFVNGEWLTSFSTTCFPGGFGQYKAGYNPGIGTPSVNQSWRENEDVPSPGLNEFNLESHQWSQIALSWNWMGDLVAEGTGYNGGNYVPPDRFFYLTINGKSIESMWEAPPECADNIAPQYLNYEYGTNYQHYWGFFWTKVYPLGHGLHWTPTWNDYAEPLWGEYIMGNTPNYFRFGETSSGWWRNNVADSTYDDYVSNKKQHMDPNLEMEFSYGRYYVNDDAAYTSPEFNLFRELDLQDDKVQLVNISWTAYWPLPAENAFAANHARFNDNLNPANNNSYVSIEGLTPAARKYSVNNQPDPMAWKWGKDYAPFSIDIFDPNAGKWYYESQGFNKIDMPNSSEGSFDPQWLGDSLTWQGSKNQKFQFKVHFNVKPGQTLLVSPIFEDISFFFALGKVRMVYWQKD